MRRAVAVLLAASLALACGTPTEPIIGSPPPSVSPPAPIGSPITPPSP